MHLLNLLFNWIFHVKSIHIYIFFLTNPMNSSNSLILVRRIPPRITDHYIIGKSQIKSSTSCFNGNNQKLAILDLFELFNDTLPLLNRDIAFDYAKIDSLIDEPELDHRNDGDPLSKYYTFLISGLNFIEDFINSKKFRALFDWFYLIGNLYLEVFLFDVRVCPQLFPTNWAVSLFQ